MTTKVNQATNHFLNIPTNPVMHCIDTPSFNGQLHDPVRVKELGELLTKVAAGVDAFLFVVKCTRYRYAESIMRAHAGKAETIWI